MTQFSWTNPLAPSAGSNRVEIDQSRAKADGDIVAGSKVGTVIYVTPSPPPSGIVDQLLQKLRFEIEQEETILHTVNSLRVYYNKRSEDGIDGLDAKLEAADRMDIKLRAYERKEEFAKLLEAWSMYASAQEIFAFLLAHAETLFERKIRPMIVAGKSRDEIDEATAAYILDPTIAQCGTSIFVINHSIALGMLYWLAEQCYIRWHP